MSKNGPCQLSVHRAAPVTAVAIWEGQNGHYTRLCKSCLDIWFDAADDDEDLEPASWAWLTPPMPAVGDIVSWARDPRNHREVAEVLRREARIHPDWLRSFLAREWRAGSILAFG